MLNSQAKAIISLVNGGINGGKVCLEENVNLAEVLSFAKKHQMHGIILYGLLAAGYNSNEKVLSKFFSAAITETVIHEKQNAAITAIFNMFDNQGVTYMPLKGVLLKELYSKPEMRVMSDADILIKVEQYSKIKDIMQTLGYTEAYESDHEIVWKNEMLTVEFHKHLMPSYNYEFYSYFKNAWEHAENVTDYRYRLKPNDEFIFIFTHFAKHYRDGGIGIKHLIDLWLMLQKFDINETYVLNELEKISLNTFYLNIKKTLEYWFNNGIGDEITEHIINTMIKGGAYGLSDNKITARVALNTGKHNSRIVAILKMVFPPVRVLALKYKFIKSAPILLPIAWVCRWANALFVNRTRLIRGAKYVKIASSTATIKHIEALKKVGIEYHLKKDE